MWQSVVQFEFWASRGLEKGFARRPSRPRKKPETGPRTKGNLKEVMSPILRGDLLRLGRLFAAGKRRSHPLVANSQRCLAPVRVVFGVGSASLFDQNGSGAREACTFSRRLSFIILVVRGGQASLSPIIRCFVPARVLVRGVFPTTRQNGLLASTARTFSKRSCFIILGRFCKIGAPPRRETHV